jgi:hypothetical protein
VYEAEHLEEWEEKFFWTTRRKKTREAQLATDVLFDEAQSEEGQEPPSTRTQDYEDMKPLTEELIDTLMDLLFFADFTIPKLPSAKSKVSYSIWQSGVGCNTSMGSSREFENNRCEILRLLLTITGKAMYMSSSKDYHSSSKRNLAYLSLQACYRFGVSEPSHTLPVARRNRRF